MVEAVPADKAETRCPRCGGDFHCGIADATPCACTTVAIDADTTRRLRERYQGCLCLRCLRELAQAPAQRAGG